MSNRFSYVHASSWEEATALLAGEEHGVVAKGAGVDLWDLIKEGISRPELVVSLLGIPGAKHITKSDKTLTIGAMATLAAIGSHPDVMKEVAALAQAAGSAASPAIRNAATLAGNLCQRPRCGYFRSLSHPCLRKGGGRCFAQDGHHQNHAIFDTDGCIATGASSLAPALVALEASVVVRGPGAVSRTLPVEKLFLHASQNPTQEVDLRRGELIEQVSIPLTGAVSVYHKTRARDGFDWPMVEVAVAVRTDRQKTITAARVVMGAVAMVPWRAVDTEKVLIGSKLTEDIVRKAAKVAANGATPLRDNGHKVVIARSTVGKALEKVSQSINGAP